MNELALFAGAGGGILGGKLLGWRTICAVEIDSYARSVLLARQRDGILEPFPIWDDVTTFDGNSWRGVVDVVSGGFPCQDISAAGGGAGLSGARSGLWSEFARIIGEVQSAYVLVENSPMLTIRGISRVLGDLATLGYDARWGVVSAENAGALHRRERIWIVANAMQNGRDPRGYDAEEWRHILHGSIRKTGETPSRWENGAPRINETNDLADWTIAYGGTVRGVDELANWMDRIGVIGNGQVPAVVRLAWDILSKGRDA